jgi:hypothetical protein
MNTTKNINYKLLAEAISHYETFGYKQIEVPWIISSDEMRFRPITDDSFILDKGIFCGSVNSPFELIGSAEQSFAWLIAEKLLSPGKYMSVTPCFRSDPEDVFHQRYFMKLELIQFNPAYSFEHPSPVNPFNDFMDMVGNVKRYYESILNDHREGLQVHYDSHYYMDLDNCSIDLMYNRIELGSYGIRTITDLEDNAFTYVYGTGIALPRFSIAMDYKWS